MRGALITLAAIGRISALVGVVGTGVLTFAQPAEWLTWPLALGLTAGGWVVAEIAERKLDIDRPWTTRI